MLSIQTLGKVSKGKVAYYTELATSSYYTEAEEPEGKFHGLLATQLGIGDQSVSHEILNNLAKGFSPKGKALVKNAGDEHRMGFDLTFSAPKSVSVCFALAGDDLKEQIRKAQDLAVKKALDYVEQNLISTRAGFEDNGSRLHVKTQNALYAMFEHASSRANDPALHTHAILLNFTQLKNTQFRCLEIPSLFQYKKVIGALYRSELASQMELLGFSVEKDDDFFAVSGINKSLCSLFSKRKSQISELIKKGGFSHANSKLKQKAALFTRSKKQKITRSELFDQWMEEATQLGYGQSTVDAARKAKKQRKEVCAAALVEQLTEKQALFTKEHVLEQIFIAHQHVGKCADQATQFADWFFNNSQHLKVVCHPQLGSLYTTQKHYDLEKEFYRRSIDYQDKSFLNSSTGATTPTQQRLNSEQSKAFKHLVKSDSSLKILNGAPGTGKSFLLRAVREFHEECEQDIIGCAVAASAADELYKSSGIKSQTIDSLLIELDSGRKSIKRNSIIIVDEAGMVGIRKLSRLLDYAMVSRSKLVLVGDHNQLSPIESGYGFMNLVKTLPKAELKDIRRQDSKLDIDNIKKIEQGRTLEVLSDLKQRGLLTFDSDQVKCKFNLVSDWYRAQQKAGTSNAMLASTRHDVNELNLIARAKLIEESQLSRVQATFTNHHGDEVEVAEGETVMFRSNSKDLEVRNGMTANVQKVVKMRRSSHLQLTVLTEDGVELKFSTSKYNSLEYGYAMSVHKSQGKTVDNAFVWLSERFLNKELNYVQMSRARFQTKTYGASSLLSEEEFQAQIAARADTESHKADLSKALE